MSSNSAAGKDDEGAHQHSSDPTPTVAAFSPSTLSNVSAANKHRSTVLVHQKSPLLLATPPQITRALAYSHPFLLPLNQLAGLLTWTSGDPWQSFLLVAGFWAIVLYGDAITRWAGPLVVVIGLIVGMYGRRYSPLSSTSWTGEKKKGHKREPSEATNVKHQKTLDEIVDTLKEFTSRCNLLMDPFLQLTDFLSTQRTATSATTRPALTRLFFRILLVTPFWILFALPPINIISTKRLALVVGTLMLTWHSKPTRVTRTLLWRSSFIRRICSVITGLEFSSPLTPPSLPPRNQDSSSASATSKDEKGYHAQASLAASDAKRRASAAGVRFTFILYENQRRWVGIGWTTSLFPYERSPWTDEHLNPAPSRNDFQLPEVEGGNARWRWVRESKWLVEGAGEFEEGGVNAKADTNNGGQGWIYYDNKWQNGRRGVDGWGKYTRRRKWYRDAELVEVTPSTEITPEPTPSPSDSSTDNVNPTSPEKKPTTSTPARNRTNTGSSTKPAELPPASHPQPIAIAQPQPQYQGYFHDLNSTDGETSSLSTSTSTKSSSMRRRGTGSLSLEERERERERREQLEQEGEGTGLPGHKAMPARHADWGVGDEARMGLE